MIDFINNHGSTLLLIILLLTTLKYDLMSKVPSNVRLLIAISAFIIAMCGVMWQ